MNEKVEMKRWFDYELWAGNKWLEVLDAAQNEDLSKVMEHVVFAFEIWRERVLGLPRGEYTGLLRDRLAAARTSWQRIIEESDMGAIIHYQNLAGKPFSTVLRDIVRHVTNHGTYHRGQMREIAERAGLVFPETDFTIFTREFQATNSP